MDVVQCINPLGEKQRLAGLQEFARRILTICREATPRDSILHKSKTRFKEKCEKGQPSSCTHTNHTHSQSLTDSVPLHAPLNSWVISIQLALFIFSGMPSPQPASSSSTADFITMVNTKGEHKGEAEQNVQNFTKHKIQKEHASTWTQTESILSTWDLI